MIDLPLSYPFYLALVSIDSYGGSEGDKVVKSYPRQARFVFSSPGGLSSLLVR